MATKRSSHSKIDAAIRKTAKAIEKKKAAKKKSDELVAKRKKLVSMKKTLSGL